jgi:LacI family transcriptional regulator
MTVGAIVPTIDYAIFARAIQTMQSHLAEAGYYLIVASHEYNPLAEENSLRALIERGIDAVVLVGTDHSSAVLHLIKERDFPCLLTWSIHSSIPSVGFDNVRAGEIAAKHLLGLGHRRFGIISGRLRYNDRARDRLEGIRSALKAKKLTLETAYITEQSFSLNGGRAGFSKLASLGEPPSAIIGGNDLLAIGAMFEAQARGMKVPRQLSIVGIDDLDLASHVSPALTTVHLPSAELGQQAAQILLAMLSGEKKTQTVELPVELVTRGSTTMVDVRDNGDMRPSPRR